MRREILMAFTILPFVSFQARGEDHFFDSNGVRIRYTDEGQGPPIVLIHGFTASGDLNWRLPGMVRMLANNHRVITLDNRGHGKSDKPANASDYGVNMVDDVLRLVDHLNIEKAHFVGYSMGGMITMKLATVAPQRMLSAVVGGMGWVPQGPISEARAGESRGTPSLQACARAFPQLGITSEELGAIEIPMVIVIGTDDGLLARRVDPLRDERPDISVIEIKGANHVSCIFHPEFRTAIKDFLSEQVAQ